MQSQGQIVCSGCRSVLVYPIGGGATNVRCSFCNAITPVPLQVPRPGMGMAQLICGGCRTLLMHAHGAASVRCSCCQTVNLTPASNVAHVNCGNCRTTLMYPYGAPSVKCAVCHYITNVSMSDARVPIPMHQPSGTQAPAPSPMHQPSVTQTPAPMPSTSTGLPHSQTQTVVVENPMSLDKSGKLVSNVVVGVTTGKN